MPKTFLRVMRKQCVSIGSDCPSHFHCNLIVIQGSQPRVILPHRVKKASGRVLVGRHQIC